MLRRVVMIGAGQAAFQAVDTLRRRGFDGSITILGEEPLEPYQRPPLSKGYLAGTVSPERLLLRPPTFYAQHRIALHLDTRATAIDRNSRRVRLGDGGTVEYDALVLATGSRPRRLEVPGSDLEGVHYLRTADDAQRLREALRPGARLIVIGGGYIGLEVAATCRTLGLEVTVLEAADRLLARVASPAVSRFYETQHVHHGVQVLCQAQVVEFMPADRSRRVAAVRTANEIYPADVVLVGIGVRPAIELAAAAGLDCSGGIAVDAQGRTADPHIHAAGDCTNLASPRYGRRVHLESVDNAFEQGTTAALDLLGGSAARAHDKAPWFWSDQYDLHLVIVGLADAHDRVIVRGTPAARDFSVCYLKATELVAIETVNRAKDQLAARKLIAAHARFDPERLADAAIPLGQCVLSATAQSAK